MSGKMNGIYAIKPKFQELLRPSEAALISLGVHPDAITFSALGLSIAGGFALFLAQEPGMLVLFCTMPFVTLGRTILNALDGMVAKDTGLARPWGEVLNEFSDRLADIALFGGLIFSRFCNPQLMSVSLVSVILSSYLGILAKSAGGSRQYGGLMGKADRMILLALAGPLAFILAVTGVCQPHIVFDVFALVVLGGSLLTMVERARKTYADLKSNND
jgi:CDP-diacylglycerol--glycerol-3-phosphate 3-phosphatidyltransferase